MWGKGKDKGKMGGTKGKDKGGFKGGCKGGGKGKGGGGGDMWSEITSWFGGEDVMWNMMSSMMGMDKGKGKGGSKGKSKEPSGPPPSAELVARVKAVQRMDGGKDVWTAFIERVGGSKRDPALRTQEELETFLAEADPHGSTVGTEVRPPKSQDDPEDDDWWSWMMDPFGSWSGSSGKGESGGSKFLPQSAEHANLVARVKAIQSTDKQAGSDRWGDFIFERGGKRDPASRTPAELEDFLGMADPNGATADLRGEFDEDMALVAQVKLGQRNSEAFKAAWLEYCEVNCMGLKDPTRHSTEVLRDFLAAAPPVTAVESDEEHRKLVDQIKEGQRADENYKHAWWKYCEVNGKTFMDPAKHDKAFLNSFISTFVPGQVPPQAAVGGAEAAAAAGYGNYGHYGKTFDKGKGKGKGKDKDKGGKGKKAGPYGGYWS